MSQIEINPKIIADLNKIGDLVDIFALSIEFVPLIEKPFVNWSILANSAY